MRKQKKAFRIAAMVAAMGAAFSGSAWSANDFTALKLEVESLKQQIQSLKSDAGSQAGGSVGGDLAAANRLPAMAADSVTHLSGYDRSAIHREAGQPARSTRSSSRRSFTMPTRISCSSRRNSTSRRTRPAEPTSTLNTPT